MYLAKTPSPKTLMCFRRISTQHKSPAIWSGFLYYEINKRRVSLKMNRETHKTGNTQEASIGIADPGNNLRGLGWRAATRTKKSGAPDRI